ncbi:hypothetical protein ACFSSA_12660 [Luteolibacter algae]|uniref:Uncharacterized protein n=1 Tax=Luteolibacter algae TaxID=454151 RepID=A0ABW5DCZ9_9BACT
MSSLSQDIPPSREPLHILSCAIGYSPDRIQEFLKSFIRHTEHAEMTLFIHKKHADDYESINHPRITFRAVDHRIPKKQHIEEIIPDFFLTLLGLRNKTDARFYPVMCGRHFYYAEYLKKEVFQEGKCPTVMLTDSRDVVFQRDPEPLAEGVDVEFALEDSLIRDEKKNRKWIAGLFGDEVASELEQYPVSCAGTTLARGPVMLDYLAKMTGTLLRNRPLVCRRTCYDQGSHNQIVRKGNLPNPTYNDPFSERIATLAVTEDLKVNFEGDKILINGKAPAVIHQWDRHPELAEFVTRTYA